MEDAKDTINKTKNKVWNSIVLTPQNLLMDFYNNYLQLYKEYALNSLLFIMYSLIVIGVFLTLMGGYIVYLITIITIYIGVYLFYLIKGLSLMIRDKFTNNNNNNNSKNK